MTVEACAKVNLTLKILGTLPGGYHALSSVVAPIALADTLEFVPAEAFSTDTGFADDLILKAARVLTDAAPDRDLPAYSVHVTKRIPVGGGLGGGSADAAAALRALNVLWKLGLSTAALVTLAARVGSDVPALVLAQENRRCVLMEGRGEKVSDLPNYVHGKNETPWLVLANPNVSASTPAVFARYDLEKGKRSRCRNDLQKPAIALYPRIGEALDCLRRAGARSVRMSGSGATVFGFASSPEHAAALATRVHAAGFLSYLTTICQS